MTNDNYTNDWLNSFIQSHPYNYESAIKKLIPDLYVEINKKYPQLKNYKFKTKLYWFIHNLTDFPTYVCPVCGRKEYLNVDVVNVFSGYDKYINRKGCSLRCVQLNSEVIDKKKNTSIEKYGVENYSTSSECKQKMSETMCKKYGVAHYSQLEEWREKIKSTCMQRYGEDHFSKTKMFSEQVRKTWENKEPDEIKEIDNKRKQTCIKKYGSEASSNCECVKEKIRKTMLDRYGVEYSTQLSEIYDKIKRTCLIKYGVEYASQSSEFRNRVKSTCLSKYGVENYAQSYEYHKNKRHKYHSEKYPELTFDSTWEVKVYEFCRDNNIQVEYSPEISYEYEYEGKIWTYHPDFLINERVYEVKGDNFFRINESTGQEEMFNPYRKQEWSDERYEWECGKYEAKHQCMLRNNVIILRESQIENLDSVFC